MALIKGKVQKTKAFCKIFIIWFIPLCIVFSYVFFLEYHKALDKLKNTETSNVTLAQRTIKNVLSERISDLLTLADLTQLHIAEGIQGQAPEHVSDEFKAFSANKREYDQIRLLDLAGQEIIRINSEDNLPIVVTLNKLQNKQHRYYFKETIALTAGEVFISPLDLNIEQGAIELPIKPMIRLGTPIYSQTGKKSGILLLNYLAQNLLNKVSLSTHNQAQNISLVNAQGYWLKHSKNHLTWGFMYNNTQRFQTYYPTLWAQIIKQDTGQIATAAGIFTFDSIYPVAEAAHIHQHITLSTHNDIFSNKEYVWKVIAFIPNSKLNSIRQHILVKFAYVTLPLLFLLIIVSWRLARYKLKHAQAEQALSQSYQLLEQRIKERTQALQHEVEIRTEAEERMRHMASYDALTSIPNRALFDDRLLTAMAMNRRHQSRSALLFIDLDDFKAVNDDYGHETGDFVLKQVSKRLKQTIRDSDTVGRYGGDEFVVLLHEINSATDATLVAKQIITLIAANYIIDDITAHIGCSIGIAIYNNEPITAQQLINQADEAMYAIKKTGKNNYKLTSS